MHYGPSLAGWQLRNLNRKSKARLHQAWAYRESPRSRREDVVHHYLARRRRAETYREHDLAWRPNHPLRPAEGDEFGMDTEYVEVFKGIATAANHDHLISDRRNMSGQPGSRQFPRSATCIILISAEQTRRGRTQPARQQGMFTAANRLQAVCTRFPVHPLQQISRARESAGRYRSADPRERNKTELFWCGNGASLGNRRGQRHRNAKGGDKQEIPEKTRRPANVKAVHDKVSTFEINFRKMSLALPAHILTGALSDMRPEQLLISRRKVCAVNLAPPKTKMWMVLVLAHMCHSCGRNVLLLLLFLAAASFATRRRPQGQVQEGGVGLPRRGCRKKITYMRRGGERIGPCPTVTSQYPGLLQLDIRAERARTVTPHPPFNSRRLGDAVIHLRGPGAATRRQKGPHSRSVPRTGDILPRKDSGHPSPPQTRRLLSANTDCFFYFQELAQRRLKAVHYKLSTSEMNLRKKSLPLHAYIVAGAVTVLACSPPTKADEPGSIPGRVTPDFRMWESCRTMPQVGGFSRGSPASPVLAFRRCSILASLHPHRLSRSRHWRTLANDAILVARAARVGWMSGCYASVLLVLCVYPSHGGPDSYFRRCCHQAAGGRGREAAEGGREGRTGYFWVSNRCPVCWAGGCHPPPPPQAHVARDTWINPRPFFPRPRASHVATFLATHASSHLGLIIPVLGDVVGYSALSCRDHTAEDEHSTTRHFQCDCSNLQPDSLLTRHEPFRRR
ncbi:hypothetical protein PR048_026055 [Dryococelus australis]|uniref:Uncharacterized protein n=1 Tax=Dryococelus australis TaxID=614101 RepID=A0ABQ9GK88_9NEOP|nr:hypothetical protein PR048_026055 [Dryococelus australis]